MKRRSFTFGLGALIAAPAMPVAAMVPAPAAAMTQHFARAKLLARCHGSASPAMLGRLLKIDPTTSNGVFNLLRERGVVSHGIDGDARAVNPLNTNCIPSEAIRARDLGQQVADTREKVRKIWDRLKEDEDASIVEPDDPDTNVPVDADISEIPDSTT